MTKLQRLCALGAILASAWPALAFAEHISTFWRLEPIDAILPTSIDVGKPALTQRVLPIGLVALTEPITIGGRSMVAGTLMFEVFNGEGKAGYCPAPGRRLPSPLAALRVPIMDQRPCLVDTNKDGLFDAVFYAFEQAGGLPTYRGSINGATPLPSTVGFRQEDIHNYPNDLSVSLVLSAKWPKRVSAVIEFSRNELSDYIPAQGVMRDGAAYLDVMNVQMRVLSVDGDKAQVAVSVDKDLCMRSDLGGNIFWGPAPPGALTD